MTHIRISVLEGILQDRLPRIEKRADMTDYQRGCADTVLDIHNACKEVEKNPPPTDPYALVHITAHQQTHIPQ